MLNGVTLVVDFYTLWKEALATLGAATGKDGTTILGGHACAETKLALTAALGRLICSLTHNVFF